MIGGNSLMMMMIMMIRPRSPIIIRTNKDTAMTLTLITPEARAPYLETLLIQLIEGELFNCFGCSFLLFLAEITCKTFKDKQSCLFWRQIPSWWNKPWFLVWDQSLCSACFSWALFRVSFSLRLRAGVQVSRPASVLSLLRWKTPIDEPVEVTEVEESMEKIYGDEED